jgi:hypothetical protein
MVYKLERRLHGEAYIGNGFHVVIQNFGIICATLEFCDVFLLLETHEDSMREVLAIRVLYAACIQQTDVNTSSAINNLMNSPSLDRYESLT